MRAVVQRVSRASVEVEGKVVGAISTGLLVLLGVTKGDGPADVESLVDKIAELRIFPDDEGKMNRSVAAVGGGILVVSQFTLYGDVRKGRRPSFLGAAEPGVAEPLMAEFVASLRRRDLTVATGEFGASMEVSLVNKGPVTLLIETKDGKVQ
ncbi:MAG TPA: D-aminoacyl-tRNA deacylase [Acidimicrobiia bacterium]|nr:D-aminoacyl-tRNA deacylase [Acidimicrobiia bacterium]